MMVDDLWVLLKRPLITNQNLNDVSEMLFVKSCWHGVNKKDKNQIKLRVSIIGPIDDVRNKVD